MKEIKISKGYTVVVDDEDYDKISQHKWCSMVRRRKDGTTRIYCYRSIGVGGGRQETQMIHRFLTKAPKGMDVDHINGDGLDNRMCNLRVCTRSENMRNSLPSYGLSSRYKGVSWRKNANKWRSYIVINGREKHIGFYVSEIEAAHAYDAAAIMYFGDFAQINTYEAQND